MGTTPIHCGLPRGVTAQFYLEQSEGFWLLSDSVAALLKILRGLNEKDRAANSKEDREGKLSGLEPFKPTADITLFTWPNQS
jgi:hypothetical protein